MDSVHDSSLQPCAKSAPHQVRRRFSQAHRPGLCVCFQRPNHIVIQVKRGPHASQDGTRSHVMSMLLRGCHRQQFDAPGPGLAPGRLLYILYFPRSSSFSPSRYLRNSSAVTRSDILAACFEFFSTSSSTNIGQSTRSASASASDGRESMLITSPLRSSQITAKKVSSRSSVTTTLCTCVSKPVSTFLIKSCVIGRGALTFSISSAIAFAS